jgi:5-methyltetrahydropteroyltriglutamate--homocysteine methyltransferase
MKVRFEIQLSGEATGSPVVTDGQRRNYHNFCTYCVYGLPNTAPDGFKIPF